MYPWRSDWARSLAGWLGKVPGGGASGTNRGGPGGPGQREHTADAHSTARQAASPAMPARVRASVGEEDRPPHVPGAHCCGVKWDAAKRPCNSEDPCRRRLGARARVGSVQEDGSFPRAPSCVALESPPAPHCSAQHCSLSTAAEESARERGRGGRGRVGRVQCLISFRPRQNPRLLGNAYSALSAASGGAGRRLDQSPYRPYL